MKRSIGILVIISSTILVYFLHSVLKGEIIPIMLFFLSIFLVVLDYQRRYFYIVGLILYPFITIIHVVMVRDQSLYPVVIFYELSMIAMILFGAYLGAKIKLWMERKI